jgi:hypothetical protein
MRNIVIGAGLLLGAALLTGTPAKAAYTGCACVKLGAPTTCTATVIDCNTKVGGVCLSVCAYEPPKAAKMSKGKKKKKM